MLSKPVNFKNFKLEAFELEKTSSKMSLSDVFADRKNSYLNEFTLFLAHFNAIPNFIHEINIDCVKANNWFAELYKNEIKDLHYNKIYFKRNSKKAEYDDIFYILFEDLIVGFDMNMSVVRFLFRKTEIDKVETLIDGIRKFRKRKEKRNPKIAVVVNNIHGIGTESLKISRNRLNIDDNYNDDFKEVHQIILKRLSKKNDKGLILLHGTPGTGKTSYIRYLISY